jgi:hypothetical protein
MDKAEERYYLDLFLKLRPDLSASEIEPSEAPDFLARHGGQTVGIELVRFLFAHVSGPSPAAIENYRNQLVKKLREGHTSRGIPPVHVSVHFGRDEILLSRQQRSDLAEQLLAFVAANMPSENSSVEFDYVRLPRALSAMGVHSLHVFRRNALTKPFWSLPYASYIPESTADRLQAVIDNKEANLAAYRKRAKHLWLVIISGTQGLQSMLDLDAGLLDADYTTGFHRVFLLRTFGSEVHELTRRPSSTRAQSQPAFRPAPSVDDRHG